VSRLFLIILALFAAPAAAQAQRENAIRPELVLRTAAVPGQPADLAILMRTTPGWHGYWLNPGDAGLPMSVDWRLPPGWRVEPLRYPVPGRLLVAGIVNHVYERDYAVLTRLIAPPGASGTQRISAAMRWLACTDKVCVPESGEVAVDVPVGQAGGADPRFDQWLRALPRPLAQPARFALDGRQIRLAIPLPADVALADPYFFPADDGPVDYAAPQSVARQGDTAIVTLGRRSGEPKELAGVLAFGDGRGLEIAALPGEVARPVERAPPAVWWALLGALAGGLLLNLMPCVLPILGLKAMHLAEAGGDERAARRDALAYTAGAVLGTGALGIVLLALRAGGAAVGWSFQLQDPRSILVLLLLAVAITANLVGLFQLPALGGRSRPAGSFGTGALAAFVATPCAGPFLGTALGAALLLPAWGGVMVFAALGLGLAVPFLAIAFVPALRRRLPRPGPWMARLQAALAVPMALSALAALWLLWRQGGGEALLVGLAGALGVVLLLALLGRDQKSGRRRGIAAVGAVALVAAAAIAFMPLAGTARPDSALRGAAWSEAAVRSALAQGKPVFVNFTADWCLTCKANEAAAIDRDSVRQAFREARVVELTGDWTDGDPAITRLLESRGRAGVPLYLWYEPGRAEPEELPQVLTPTMLSSRASRPR
jgi:DsbC/DsbD-like thiol-disulfide interchange protein/cytochrome c biogenesis protein CcdA